MSATEISINFFDELTMLNSPPKLTSFIVNTNNPRPDMIHLRKLFDESFKLEEASNNAGDIDQSFPKIPDIFQSSSKQNSTLDINLNENHEINNNFLVTPVKQPILIKRNCNSSIKKKSLKRDLTILFHGRSFTSPSSLKKSQPRYALNKEVDMKYNGEFHLEAFLSKYVENKQN